MFERYANLLKEESLVIIQAKISKDDYSGGTRIVAEKVLDLARARSAQASNLLITLDVRDAALDVEAFKHVLRQQCDDDGISVMVNTQMAGASVDIKLGLDWRILPTDEMIENLTEMSAVCSVEML